MSTQKHYSESEIEEFVSSTRKATIQECREAVPAIKYSRHQFRVGENWCALCATPRIVVDRRRVVIRRDEKTGGEVAEVTETRIDTTDHMCLKNSADDFNDCRQETLDALQALEEKQV